MTDRATGYVVLRDRRVWDGVRTSGLEPEPDGVLTLARVPGPADGKPIVVEGPLDVELSGIATGPSGDVYVADTAGNRILYLDGLCGERVVILPANAGAAASVLAGPRGLLQMDRRLFVADSDHSRILVLRAATLEARDQWDGPLQRPTSLAADSERRIYVVDRLLNRVLRFSASGVFDRGYRIIPPQPLSPFAVAIGPDDVLYVADDRMNRVRRFARDGSALDLLPPPPVAPDASPRALAIVGARLYVGDAHAGGILVFDCVADAWLGSLSGYRGPVTALAAAADGALYVKPAADGSFHRFEGGAAVVKEGHLEAGPFDAGEGAVWGRVAVDAEVPEATAVRMRLYARNTPVPPPTDADWGSTQAEVAGFDALVSAGHRPDPAIRATDRFLWLRVAVESDHSARLTPRVSQVSAETEEETYLDYLPAIYRREDASRGFLRRWLELFRSEMGDLELAIDDLPRLFDAQTAPEGNLARLAGWLAFDPPPGMDANALRQKILAAHAINRRRGTAAGLREFIELYTGARAVILEPFTGRRLWQLGTRSALGFDTALPVSLPDGMVVPGPVPAQSRYFGLGGDYYLGSFRYRWASRLDAELNFDLNPQSNPPAAWVPHLAPEQTPQNPAALGIEPGVISVRWQGQIKAPRSGIYEFHVVLNGGCRLWVDGESIIDTWAQPSAEARGLVPLSDRWSPILVEYYGPRVSARFRLLWSSRDHAEEVVPHSRLYSVLDDNVDLDVLDTRCVPHESAIAGETVVGRNGPLARGGFGTPLFADDAHLFCVLVPAAQACRPRAAESIARVIDAEKPAHADYHLCLLEPRMRVGFQARVGVDAIVGGVPEALPLGDALLGVDLVLGARDQGDEPMRVGQRASVGRNAALR